MSEPITLAGMNIQLRLQTPYDIVMTAGLNGEVTDETLAATMNLLTRAAEREEIKGEIRSLQAVMSRNRERLEKGDFDRSIQDLRAERADYDKQITTNWVARQKRGPVALSQAQQVKFAEFEKKIRAAENGKLEVERGLIIYQWQLDCLHARLAGAEPPPKPPELLRVLSEIELPEAVDITQQAA